MEPHHYFNPYTGNNFFDFFVTLFIRIYGFIFGDLKWTEMAADEIQIVVLLGVASSSALVGTFLVLRKMTMLANSLSHTILLGIVAAYLLTRDTLLTEGHGGINLTAMLIASLVMGLLTAFLTEFLTKTAKLQEDASTGIVFTTLFALGIVLVTLLTRSAHIGTEAVMGNVDALQIEDCKLVFVILAINCAVFFVFFKEFTITTFDAGLARAFGYSVVFFNYLLMALVSMTVVGAFRAVGVLMVLAFITGPVLTARVLTHSLKKMIFLAMFIGSMAAAIGVALARHFLSVHDMALSTGGLVVCVIALLYVLAILISKFGKVADIF